MARETTILNLDQSDFESLKASGYIAVSVEGKTYKMPLGDLEGLGGGAFVATQETPISKILDAYTSEKIVVYKNGVSLSYCVSADAVHGATFLRVARASNEIILTKCSASNVWTVENKEFALTSEIPTATSQLTNDSGFVRVVTAESEEELPTTRDPNTLYAVVEPAATALSEEEGEAV